MIISGPQTENTNELSQGLYYYPKGTTYMYCGEGKEKGVSVMECGVLESRSLLNQTEISTECSE